MGGYFRGWRWKSGPVTLLVACAFMAGWARSMFTYDGVWLFSPKSRFGVVSNRGCLTWHYAHSRDARGTEWRLEWDSHQVRHKSDKEDNKLVSSLLLKDFWFNLSTGMWFYYSDLVRTPGPPVSVKSSAVRAPYWFLVIPITLLSAYLLLSSPRQKPSAPPRDVHQ